MVLLPAHNHVVGTGQLRYNQLLRKAPYGSNITASSTDGGSESDILNSQAIQLAGGGQFFDNCPPFYAAGMIQWVGY